MMLFSPVVGLVYGLKRSFDSSYKRKLLTLFITIFGSVITISESNDGYRHWQNVYFHYMDLSLGKFISECWEIISFKSNINIQEDLYIHFLSYITGAVLGVPWLFFVFVAFIYGYFFSGSVFRLIQLSKGRNYGRIFYFFLIVFLLWKGLEGINSIRTWTGGWVLFYACLSYYQTKKKKYLLLMFVPPYIHIGYFAMTIPAWIVLFLGVRHKLYVILFCLSFVTTIFDHGSVIKQLQTTEVGADKVRSYQVEEQRTSDYYLDQYSGSTWYLKLFALGVQNWGVNILAFSLIFFGVYKRMNLLESHLFSIGLLTKVLSNASWFLFALQNRTAIITGLFILASFLLVWQRGGFTSIAKHKAKLLRFSFILSFILLIPFVIYKIAGMIYFLSINLFLLPFIPWFDSSLNYSVREFLSFLL